MILSNIGFCSKKYSPESPKFLTWPLPKYWPRLSDHKPRPRSSSIYLQYISNAHENEKKFQKYLNLSAHKQNLFIPVDQLSNDDGNWKVLCLSNMNMGCMRHFACFGYFACVMVCDTKLRVFHHDYNYWSFFVLVIKKYGVMLSRLPLIL